MKVIKCDVCKAIVNVSDSATITIRPNNHAQRFNIPNRGSETIVDVESFDLCKECLTKSLRKYYGEHFGEGANDT